MAYEDEKKKTEDYYDMLKKENYTSLLDSQIQLDNARQRALKSTNVALAAGGMDSSGYKGTMNSGLENQYITGLQQANTDFTNKNLDLEQSKQDALNQLLTNEQNTNAQWILNIIESGEYENLNQLYEALDKYGSYQDGQFVWNDDVEISDSDKARIESLLALKNANYEFVSDESGTGEGGANATSGEIYSGKDNDKVLFYYNKDGQVLGDKEIKDVFKKETAALKSNVASGNIPKNSYVVLTNGWMDHLYLYIDSKGVYHYVNQETMKTVARNSIHIVTEQGNVYSSSDTTYFNSDWLGF